MRIDIIIDTICPWCFIGKRQLDILLDQQKSLNLDINWHTYFLNPGMPPEGIGYEEYMKNKLGQKLKIEKLHDTINQTAKNLDLKFDFTQIKRIPHSLDSHRMVKLANRQNQGGEMLESLYQNYFIMGRNIGNRSVLIEIAEKLGYNSTQVRKYLYSNKDILESLMQNQRTLSSGINGLPVFIFGEKFSISGAQDMKILQRMLNITKGSANIPNNPILQNIIPNSQYKFNSNESE
jgi:predicted DsbA family dithiol-disulfide isomerase